MMRDIGSIIAAIGAAGFLAIVFLMPTSVDAALYGGGEVTNLALQQRQLLAAMGTSALFLAGIILHAAGALLPSVAAEAAPPEDEETMSRLGITHDAHGYRAGGFVYSSFAAAAKAVQRRG
ncbi:hypothetical protein [Sphingomonas sp. UBA978]|uniref:hypothetical protein n=1 Tax=Sphingomonas sp. UBA978 TaxID=1947536 RepID=UPI0025F1877E|nr:hypothetical protein [Sphingomonas sp. UBA978]